MTANVIKGTCKSFGMARGLVAHHEKIARKESSLGTSYKPL